MKPNTVSDFWAKVDKSNKCWNWTAAKDKDGYGFFWWKNKQVRAHRFSWEITNGPISDGLMVCHKCDNPSCVRPDHLFLGTNSDNQQDCLSKGRGNVGRARSPESVAKSANGRRGKKWTLEMRKRASESKKGIKPSEETRRKMSLAHTGSIRSEEAKQKTAEAHRGMKRSPEAIANITKAQRARRAREVMK